MSQITSLIGWSQLVMYFTALVGVWYIYSAGKCLLVGKSKLGEAIRTFGLGLAWLSVWAVYNPRAFAALVPFLAKTAFLLGVAGFIIGLVWSAKANFKGFKRTSKSASASTQSSWSNLSLSIVAAEWALCSSVATQPFLRVIFFILYFYNLCVQENYCKTE